MTPYEYNDTAAYPCMQLYRSEILVMMAGVTAITMPSNHGGADGSNPIRVEMWGRLIDTNTTSSGIDGDWSYHFYTERYVVSVYANKKNQTIPQFFLFLLLLPLSFFSFFFFLSDTRPYTLSRCQLT